MAEGSKVKGAAAAVLKAVLVFILDFAINVLWSIAAFAIFTIIIGSTGGRYLSGNELLERMTESPEFLFLSCIYNIFAVILVFMAWKYIDKQDTAIIGLKWKNNSLRLFGYGLIGGALEIALIMLLSSSMGNMWFEGLGRDIFSSAELQRSILFGALAFLLVGFGEEAVFRGYVQKRLMIELGNKWALFISALIFMTAHAFTYGKLLDFIDIALGGLVLGYLYILTDSLYLPAAYHFIYDFIQVNIVKLQEYEHYKGAVLFMFNNTGDIVVSGVNYGNVVEVSFIMAEIIVLILLYIFRNSIRKMSFN